MKKEDEQRVTTKKKKERKNWPYWHYRMLFKSFHENAGENSTNNQNKNNNNNNSKKAQMLRVAVHGEILFGEWSR